MGFEPGDRVRVTQPMCEYTGCRGTVMAGALPLGYWVEIDGEKAVAQPFLAGDLEALRARRVRPAISAAETGTGT